MLNPQVNRRPVSMKQRAALAVAMLALALPIAAVSQAMSTPAGTVVDPTGRPLVDATLRLTTLGNSEQVFETRTDTTGAFQFSQVPAGEYMLAVRPGCNAVTAAMQLCRRGTTISLVSAGRHAGKRFR